MLLVVLSTFLFNLTYPTNAEVSSYTGEAEPPNLRLDQEYSPRRH